MKIDVLVLGNYETNCYILRQSQPAKDCLIIDTGLQPEQLIDFLKENNLNPVAIVLTHGHIDHTAGLESLRKNYSQIKVYIHRADADMLTNPHQNLSALAGGFFSPEPADTLIDEPDIIEEAGIKLKVLHTPGHTPGGISLYSKDENIVFTGDALFADSVGRTDFPNGSMELLIKGIKEKLFTLPNDTIAYPGHGPTTTIKREKAYNQYLQ
ncbi:MAG: MBL fold metallo-hydrolase [Planctomycetota bacterium]|jgi:glyoxylase-like metal-dependent hydrolase (beta-lactamase superfamily II)